ncbi:MAG TPA: hypothetical protein VFQ70_02135 [Candidatus Saccharimonadaceae bacterium]|nr:hypothetical protein [Candidatus Saccharimonadaceae bacterium]
MKTKKPLTAIRLRLILCGTIVIIVIVGVALFEFGQKQLSSVALTVAEAGARADASQNDLQRLQVTQTQLKQDADVVQSVSDIVAESKNHLYQNQVINDLDSFAASSGVTITSITFASTTPATKGATPPPASPAGPTAVGGIPGGAAAAVGMAGITPVSETISLQAPIDYNAFLQFLHDIEQNLTNMQLQSLSLSSDTSGLSSNDLTIQVYIR